MATGSGNVNSKHGLESEVEQQYDLIREAGNGETIFALAAEKALQSNIVVAATYRHDNDDCLTRASVFPALQTVVKEHPEMSTIAVERDFSSNTRQWSFSSKERHRIWEARLRAINLENCVDFVDYDSSKGIDDLQSAIQNALNEWFPTTISKPRWKLVILNGKHVLYVYDHLVGDGRSGYAFHRSFLAALNSANSSARSEVGESQGWVVSGPKRNPPVYWWRQVPDKVSKVGLVIYFLWTKLLQIVFPLSTRYFSDAMFDAGSSSVITHVATICIPAARQSALLTACRHHGTTLTELLHTVITATLAVDVYPRARLGASTVTVDMRPYTIPPQSSALMVNSAGAYLDTTLLGKYRATASTCSDTVDMDVERVWALTLAFKRRFRHALSIDRKQIQFMLALNLPGPDKEDIFDKCLAPVTTSMRGSFFISNLGVFDPGLKGDFAVAEPSLSPSPSPWNIIGTRFSFGAHKGAGVPGFFGAGVKGGETTISVTYEKGLLDEKMVEKTLEGVRKRLWALSET